MKKLRLIAAALTAALVLGLCACGEQPGPGQETDAFQETDPTHIYEEAGEHLLVDAEVIGPAGNAVPKVYVTAPPEITKESIDALLAHFGDAVETIVAEHADGDCYSYYAKTKNGAEVILSAGYDVNSITCGFSYDTPSYPDAYNYLIEGHDRARNGPTLPEIEEVKALYAAPKEFSFATKEQAEEEARAALSVFDLDNLILYKTLYADHETLAAREAEFMEEIEGDDPFYAGFTYTPKDDWSEEDDCYVFTFCTGADDIPMVESAFYNSVSLTVPCHVTVWYNSHGIAFLSVDCPWVPREAAQTPDRIVSAAEAMETVKEKLNGAYLGHDIVVEEIALRYYPTQDKDRWLLIPVWETLIRKKDVVSPYIPDDPLHDERSYVLINALTGEEL